MEPINIDFSLKHLVDINKIEVVIWNLKEYSPQTIEAIEDQVIETIYPFCNTETSNLRNKLNKLFSETENIIKIHNRYDKKLETCFSYFQKIILEGTSSDKSTKPFYKLKYAREYFVDVKDKYHNLLRDIFIDWCQIVESNNVQV